jgi:hypothetical protein
VPYVVGQRKDAKHKTTPTRVSFCAQHCVVRRRKDAGHETTPTSVSFHVRDVCKRHQVQNHTVVGIVSCLACGKGRKVADQVTGCSACVGDLHGKG